MHKYYIFYKPYLTISQFSPEGDKVTLAQHLPDIAKNVYPVGRLDHDSEGLLLLTDDKPLTNQLLNPEFGHKRTYYVQVDGAITPDAIAQLKKGVTITIDGKQHLTKKAEVVLLNEEPLLPERNPPIRVRKSIPVSWIAITLTEGKNRQVRRMTAAVGFPTLRLVRYAIGGITIAGIQPGQFRVYDASIKALLLHK